VTIVDEFLFAFYSRLDLTKALSCVVFEIKRHIGRKLGFFSYPAFDAPLGGPRRNIAITFGVEKLEWWRYQMV